MSPRPAAASPWRLRARLLAPAVALVLVLGAACSGGSSSKVADSRPTSTTARRETTTTTAAPFVPAPLRWEGCSQGQCATLAVPLDPAQPQGPIINLALARVPAGNPSARIGSLLINPGGPGVGGAKYARAVAQGLPAAVRDRFDVVGWDPRGTGGSTRVDCGDRLDYLFDVDVAPDDAAEQAALEASGRRFAEACATGSGLLLGHLSTGATVQDMDVIRQVLGDPQLTYIGFSYGTYLGARYAVQFPDKVRAFILDGALDPSLDVEATNVQQAQGFGQSLQAFLDWCDANRCRLRDGAPSARAAYDALRARIAAEPIRRSGRVLGPTHFNLAVAAPLYAGASAYEDLAAALDAARDGDPGPLLDEFDSYVGRDGGGRYDGEWAAFIATVCADGPQLPLAEFPAVQQRAGAAAPDFGAENVGFAFPCSVWPVPPEISEPEPVSAPAAPPIVVVGTTGDPATPVAWAGALAAQLGSGVLVTVEGTAHTSLLEGSSCLDGIAARYLVDLVAPVSGTRCPG